MCNNRHEHNTLFVCLLLRNFYGFNTRGQYKFTNVMVIVQYSVSSSESMTFYRIWYSVKEQPLFWTFFWQVLAGQFDTWSNNSSKNITCFNGIISKALTVTGWTVTVSLIQCTLWSLKLGQYTTMCKTGIFWVFNMICHFPHETILLETSYSDISKCFPAVGLLL